MLVACAVVAMEALALIGFGVAELVSLHRERLAMGLSTAVFFLAAGAGLAWCAWLLSRGRRGGRGPVMFAQLVALGLAWNLWPSPTRAVAVPLAAAAVVVLIGMLTPASIAALEEDHDQPA